MSLLMDEERSVACRTWHRSRPGPGVSECELANAVDLQRINLYSAVTRRCVPRAFVRVLKKFADHCADGRLLDEPINQKALVEDVQTLGFHTLPLQLEFFRVFARG